MKTLLAIVVTLVGLCLSIGNVAKEFKKARTEVTSALALK